MQHKLKHLRTCEQLRENLTLCSPLQVRLCTAGCCGTLSRTWTQPTNCSWRRCTSAPAGTDTFPSLTPRGRCTTRGRSTAASSPTSTSNIASYCWYRYWCFCLFTLVCGACFKSLIQNACYVYQPWGEILPRSLLNIKYERSEDSDCVTTCPPKNSNVRLLCKSC